MSKRRASDKLYGYGCVLFLLLAAVACDPSGRPGETPVVAPGGAASAGAQAKIGDTVRFGNWAYTVTRVDKAKTLTWTEYGNTVEALGQFVLVSLTLRNIGDRNFPINTHDFYLTDSGGIKYETSSKLELYSYVRFVKLTNLGEQFPPGIDVASALIFDVNPAAIGLRLVLRQAKDATIAL